jgi:hypothetical protein
MPFFISLRRAAPLVVLLLGVAACAAQPPAPGAGPLAAATALPTAPAAVVQPSATAAATAPPAPTTPPTPIPGVLYVDANQRLGAISRLVYGTNYGPWMGAFLPDVQRQVDTAGFTFLRFPGGEWGDQQDLNVQQIDDFIAFCRKLKAEPSISVRLRGGTPAHAAELVRYANATKKYAVRYWSIGNEPSLYSEYDIPRYNKEWRAIAQAMRAVDPTIQLVGPDINQFDSQGGPRDPTGRFTMGEFMADFLRANGDLVDIVSIHRYPFPLKPNDPDPTIAQLRDNSREWDAIIPALRSLTRETTGSDLPVAVTEVNSNWSSTFGGDATPDSFYGALWWGDVLGRLIRQRVEIVAQFALYAPESAGWGLLRAYSTRPAYYIYQLYQRFGDQLIYASSDDALVSIVAARRTDGALTLMLVNLGPEAREKPLHFAHFTPASAVETWLFDKQHKAEQLAPTPLGTPASLRLPPESMTLLIVPAK